MKTKLKEEKTDDLRKEYNLRELLKSGVQGKYAARYQEGTNLVLLDPEIAKEFPTRESVDEALRLVIQFKRLTIGSIGKKANERQRANRSLHRTGKSSGR